jgi:hypothetical protein
MVQLFCPLKYWANKAQYYSKPILVQYYTVFTNIALQLQKSVNWQPAFYK